MAHSPGPWVAREFNLNQWAVHVHDDIFHIITVINQAKDEDNAHLISAAPELLEVATHALAWHMEHKDNCGQSEYAEESFRGDPCSCIKGMLETAIAKAEGKE